MSIFLAIFMDGKVILGRLSIKRGVFVDGHLDRERTGQGGGLVHPRTRVGGGARCIQVPALAGTPETMGGAEGTEMPGQAGHDGPESPRPVPSVPCPDARSGRA